MSENSDSTSTEKCLKAGKILIEGLARLKGKAKFPEKKPHRFFGQNIHDAIQILKKRGGEN